MLKPHLFIILLNLISNQTYTSHNDHKSIAGMSIASLLGKTDHELGPHNQEPKKPSKKKPPAPKNDAQPDDDDFVMIQRPPHQSTAVLISSTINGEPTKSYEPPAVTLVPPRTSQRILPVNLASTKVEQAGNPQPKSKPSDKDKTELEALRSEYRQIQGSMNARMNAGLFGTAAGATVAQAAALVLTSNPVAIAVAGSATAITVTRSLHNTFKAADHNAGPLSAAGTLLRLKLLPRRTTDPQP